MKSRFLFCVLPPHVLEKFFWKTQPLSFLPFTTLRLYTRYDNEPP